MSHRYQAVLWNKNKKQYDLILWSFILLFNLCLVAFQFIFKSGITIETIIIRGTALSAFLLLHIILIIGPLCRLNKSFLPLLYNRRHMGVSMFILALIHGVFSMVQFHALGDTGIITSIFTSNQNYLSVSDFPFQILGFFALIIFFLMAITSHDFWLANLGPRLWKGLHMSVYLAYALILIHVATGTLQYETNPIYFYMLLGGFITISFLHIVSGWKERRALLFRKELGERGFYKAAKISEIDNNCGKSVFINGSNIAIFKYDGKVSAVDNVCKHQMGPLGEGRVVDGCITCPWHGYQYLPENGQSPPPFNEKLSTYSLEIIGEDIWVNPTPHEEGTYIEAKSINN